MAVRPGSLHRGHRPAGTGAGPAGRSVLLGVLLVLLVAACSSGPGPSGSPPATSGQALFRPTVAATTDVAASLVSAVGGDDVDVVPLLLRGQVAAAAGPGDPAIERARAADLLVAVGAGWEPWLADLEARRTLELAPALSPIPLGGSELTGSTPAAGAVDPRFWLDPDRTTQAARRIADELIALGVDRDAIDRRFDALSDELALADEAAQEAVGPIPADRRVLLAPTAHPAYLADRYGFTVVRTVGAEIPAVEVVDATAVTTGSAGPGGTAGIAVVALHLDALAPTGEPIDVPSLIRTDAAALAAALA